MHIYQSVELNLLITDQTVQNMNLVVVGIFFNKNRYINILYIYVLFLYLLAIDKYKNASGPVPNLRLVTSPCVLLTYNTYLAF